MKSKKLPLLLSLLVAMTLSLVLAFASLSFNVKAATIVQPSSFSGNSLSLAGNTSTSVLGYQLNQKLTGVPNTIEAFIKVPTTANEGGRYGVILGNFVSGGETNADALDFEVYKNGNPRLFWNNGTYSGNGTDGTANGVDWQVTGVNIATNTWTHLAFVRDVTANKVYCYVNGELVGTNADAGADFIPGTLSGSACGNLSVGKDNRDLVSANDTKSTYFQGNIAYVSLSSSTKTQTQIQDSMSKMASAKATSSQGNLLFLDYASSYDYNGESFNVINGNGYGIMETLTGAPRTFEAVIKVNKTTKLSTKRYGVIMGNFFSGDKANNDSFDLEIHENGNPRLFWHNGTYSGKATDNSVNGVDWTVKNVSLNTGKWTHLAFVRDMTADKTYCYVNGVQVGTYNEAGNDIIPGTLAGSSCGNIKIGMDSRSGGNVSTCFQGEIAYVTLSSQSKTKEQIASSASLMETCGVNKDMTTSVADLYIYDRSSVRAYYRGEYALPSAPNTITATFKLPKNYALGVGGALFGNVALNASVHGFNLELNQKGHLCVVWNANKSPNANPWVEFTSTDFRNGEWNNIAVVRDKTANCFKLYVNGALKESSSTTTGVGADIVSTYAPAIGSNFQTPDNERWLFKGCVKDVAVFSTALETSQISSFSSANKTQVSKENYPSMMLNWVLETNQQTLYYKEEISKTITDYSGNGNNGYMCTSQHYYKPSSADWLKAEDGEYTLVFMPDTQITVSRDVEYCEKNPEVKSIADLDMTKTFQWMVDNKDAMNLSFVMHMGDLKHARGVNDNYEAQNDWREWELISGKTGYLESMITNGTAATGTKTFSSSFINGQTFGFELLKQAGIPYTMVPGNHDYDNFYMIQGTGRTATYYNYYFSSASYDEKFASNVVARYNRNHKDFAENDNSMLNVIYEIDATPKGSSTPVKYLVVALEFGPNDDMIAWANEVISQPKFSGHRVIVTTHALMYCDNNFIHGDSSWTPGSYGFSKDANVLGVNNGIDIYNKLVKINDNVFMSSGGHIAQETFATRTDIGSFGNEIYSMLVDWQETFHDRGDSLLLVAKVNEKTQKITFKVYNPILDEFYCIENEKEWDFSNSLAREVTKDSDINYSKNHAKVGEKVSFTLNAQAGFVYAMPKVVDSFGNNVAVTKEGANYYFTMPTAKVSISVDEIDTSTIVFPTSINLDFGDSVDVSTYLTDAYTYTYKINGTSISNNDSVITAIGKGKSTLTVSIDGYGEVASCEIITNEIVTTVPSSITLEYNGTCNLLQYLPNTYVYSYSVQGDSISIGQGVINAISSGTSIVTISVSGYGEVASCTIVVKEQPLPPASSSSSISSSSSSEPSSSSSSSISSAISSSSSSSKVEPSSSSSSVISSSSSEIVSSSSSDTISSSANISSSNQGGQTSPTVEPSRGGCMANFGGGYTLIFVLVAVFACVIILKKKAK